MTLNSRWIRLAMATTAVAALGVSQALAQVNAPKEGSKIPNFSMVDLAGKTITNKSLAGKVVLLDFWATWCGPCKMSSPVMQRLSTKYAKKGLVVIGANTFEDDSKKMASKYMADHKYTYVTTVDNTKLAESWGIRGVPQFYVVDKKGVVRASKSGFSKTLESELDTLIAKLVKE